MRDNYIVLGKRSGKFWGYEILGRYATKGEAVAARYFAKECKYVQTCIKKRRTPYMMVSDLTPM